MQVETLMASAISGPSQPEQFRDDISKVARAVAKKEDQELALELNL